MDQVECNKWLTISEAARTLNVTEADIYTAALDGHLRLSFQFVNGATFRRATLMSREAEETYVSSGYICGPFWDKAYWNDGDWLKVEEIPTRFTGVLDIPMFGGAMLDVRRNRQRIGGGSELTLICPAGVLLESANGELFQLQEFSTKTGAYRMAAWLPSSMDFVVRSKALRGWAAQSQPKKPDGAGKSALDDGVKAITNAQDGEQSASVAAAPTSPLVAKGITKDQVLTAFGELVKGIKLKDALENGKGLFGESAPGSARTLKGTRGGRHAALWDPVLLAIGLNEKYSVPMPHLKSAFLKHSFLTKWSIEWRDALEVLDE